MRKKKIRFVILSLTLFIMSTVLLGCKHNIHKINKLDKNNQDKIFLLDHHKTAMWLNQYPFAVIETNNPEDSFSHIGIRIIDLFNYKGTGTSGNASATTLLYDFMLSVVSILNKKKHLPYDLESIKDDFLTEFCFYIGIYDTWDWVNIFNKQYDDSLNRFCHIYNCYNLSNTYFYTKNTYIKFHRTNSLTHSHSNAFLKHTNAIPFFNKLFIFLIYQSFYIKITSLKP